MTKQVYEAEGVISARQRHHYSEWIEQRMREVREEMLLETVKLTCNNFLFNWSYYGQNHKQEQTQYLNWQDVPEGDDIIIRLRVEEL